MDSKNDHVIVLKNDAVGDLTQSLKAINNIINIHKDKSIDTIQLSHTYNQKQIEWFKAGSSLNLISKAND